MKNRLGPLMTSLLSTKPPASLGLVLDRTLLDLLAHLQNPDWNSDFCISLLEAIFLRQPGLALINPTVYKALL